MASAGFADSGLRVLGDGPLAIGEGRDDGAGGVLARLTPGFGDRLGPARFGFDGENVTAFNELAVLPDLDLDPILEKNLDAPDFSLGSAGSDTLRFCGD